jgi:8-amino-7-oxononanoate synthase
VRTILVTGSDTGVGKTHVAASLARLCAGGAVRVQIVKIVETGTGELPGGEGDACRAARLAGGGVDALTLASFPLALSPPASAAAAGAELSLDALVRELRSLPPCDWRICEGAGGIATPVDTQGADWADLAAAAGVHAVVLVVPDRLGAINQARLAHGRALQAGLRAGVWLNATKPVDAAVAKSNREGIRACRVPVWAEQAFGADGPADAAGVLNRISGETGKERDCEGGDGLPGRPRTAGKPVPAWVDRFKVDLADREAKSLRRRLRVTVPHPGELNLADNDYLDLARDPSVVAAASGSAARHGTSSSASPLITGWRQPHADLVAALCAWHGLPSGLLWSSGYAANSGLLGALPRRGDLVLADRLIHNSLVAGILRSGARLQRYRHLDLDELERRLADAPAPGRTVWVVTESVFSMDGDHPDLARLAALRRSHGFLWFLDEAHALGWYGREGAGLARAAGVQGEVDVLMGTLGKALASGGAYTLFRDESVRDYAVNHAGEFIYSTALPPANAAAAGAALKRVKALAAEQPSWHAASREFRAALRDRGWSAPEGESPIVPVLLDDEGAALGLAEHLAASGIRAAAVRPPTVPDGTSRLRFSLKRTFRREDANRVLDEMKKWKATR